MNRPAFVALCSALSLCGLTAGCMRSVSTEAARSEFSSKERSMTSPPPSAAVARADKPSSRSSAAQERTAPAVPAALGSDAAEILRKAARSEWPALRAHALEASARTPALLKELAPRGLADANRGVRFVACMAIAEAREQSLAVQVQPLVADESGSVRAAALLALV
ncbi:MAG: hypothetical protein ACO3QC_06255, partial [Phycisphaerales bacterium]